MRGSDPTVPTRNLGLRSGRRTCCSTYRSYAARYSPQQVSFLTQSCTRNRTGNDGSGEGWAETWGSCGRRSWMLYLTQAITALKTCSSLRTLSSSLEIISINWLAGSSMNSSLSMTYDIRAVRQQGNICLMLLGLKMANLQSHTFFKIIHHKVKTNYNVNRDVDEFSFIHVEFLV